jgi:hypothetical protein
VLSKRTNAVIGASLLVPCPALDLYEVILDVRNVPTWAPGVRRVEVLEGYGEPGMVSEWEICFLGLKRRFLSVLEEAESPALLRWSYDGLVGGWGQCVMREQGQSTLALFQTQLWATERHLKQLMRMRSVHEAASAHLKRCLAHLGTMVSDDASHVRVGLAEGIDQSLRWVGSRPPSSPRHSLAGTG